MNALTIWQPWASLCFDGVPGTGRPAKIHETRPWPAPRELIGQHIVIHAGLRHPQPGEVSRGLLELLARVYPYRDDDPLPYGAALGTVRVVRCSLTQNAQPVDAGDLAAGNWAPGRFAWELADPRPFAVPRPMKGHQGLWIVDDALAGELARGEGLRRVHG